MRNTIDREAFKLLFGIMVFFIAVLAIISTLLFIDLKGFSPVTLKVSTTLLFLSISVALFLRSDYLKIYNYTTYESKKFGYWVGAASFLVCGIVASAVL